MRRSRSTDRSYRDIRDRHDTGRAGRDVLQNALIAGSVVCIATAAVAAWRGRADSGSAVAPINATTHVVYGPDAGDVEGVDVEHTLLGVVINAGASVFWAGIYEQLFGGGDRRQALLGGGVVAALAYLVDYHLVPKRLTPGWEERVSGRSLAMIFAAMALSLPLRSVLARRS